MEFLLGLIVLLLIVLLFVANSKKSKPKESNSTSSNMKVIKGSNNNRTLIGDKCPKCSSELVKKSGRRGYFIGCSNYPDCKYSSDYEYTDVESLRKNLRTFRAMAAKQEGYKPYTIFSDSEMESLIELKPKTKAELLKVKGFGTKKVDKYGDSILKVLNEE